MKNKLIYVMGPSGSGKDSLMKWVMQHKEPDFNLRWAPRWVTRENNDHEGTDQSITNERFDELRSSHLLAMDWSANGIRYGIEKVQLEFKHDHELIFINGSRAYFYHARSLYPDLLAIHVRASLETLESRLLGRARESIASIAERLKRAEMMVFEPEESILEVRNDGEIEISGQRVLNYLQNL
jgi:ribose 1,5-bisphosphokinase